MRRPDEEVAVAGRKVGARQHRVEEGAGFSLRGGVDGEPDALVGGGDVGRRRGRDLGRFGGERRRGRVGRVRQAERGDQPRHVLVACQRASAWASENAWARF